MKAVLIAEEAPTRVVEVAEDPENGLTLYALQELVGGMIEALPVPGRDDATAYVNDESKFTCLRNARATRFMLASLFPNDYISGPLVVMGFDANAGRNRPIPDDLLTTIMREFA